MDNALAWGVGLYLFVRIALFGVLGFWLYRVLRSEPEPSRARSSDQNRYALERRHGSDRRG